MMKAASKQSDKFYEQLAPLYHLKVDWDKRLPKEIALFDLLFGEGDISAICDLGCGDGGHAKEISRRGATYVGIDNSAQMISMAKKKFAQKKEVNFFKGDMLHLPGKYRGKFDLVMLLGNTLPHILSVADLKTLLKGVHNLLKPGGRFVLQTVNPYLLKDKSVHFLPPKLANGTVLFTPFYLRQGEFWSFQMPIYLFEQRKLTSHIIPETRLKFWSPSEITKASAWFLKVSHTFGSAGLTPYVRTKSENLILIMKRI
jgi:SAM-dependent methyltransferase